MNPKLTEFLRIVAYLALVFAFGTALSLIFGG